MPDGSSRRSRPKILNAFAYLPRASDCVSILTLATAVKDVDKRKLSVPVQFLARDATSTPRPAYLKKWKRRLWFRKGKPGVNTVHEILTLTLMKVFPPSRLYGCPFRAGDCWAGKEVTSSGSSNHSKFCGTRFNGQRGRCPESCGNICKRPNPNRRGSPFPSEPVDFVRIFLPGRFLRQTAYD
jgi:hypothetical protein